MSVFILKAKFTEIFERELEEEKLCISVYTESRIHSLINMGVTKMGSAGLAESIDKIHLAEENLARLVDYLCTCAEEYGTYPDLYDDDFDFAIAGCYPIWPFI